MKRTHTCNELTIQDVGKKACIQGWVHSRRDHGGVIFLDVRDRYGLTQIVFEPGCKPFSEAEHLRREDCIEVHGKVRPRPKGMANPNLCTGEVEVEASEMTLHNKSAVAPFEVEDRVVASDDLRLKFRYLDLRRPLMQRNLLIRHKAAQAARKFLSSQNFLEIETPLLVRSTPEGARDYIVPSRVNPGTFYALPQSPQLYKQLLMVSGCDRYFQLPRCLRDEDLRADRQPEHTQIDLEMSFPELDDLFAVGEGVISAIYKECINVELKKPFRRITHTEAMEKYGTDKPDLRYELFLHDVTSLTKKSDFKVFKDVIEKGGVVKCLCAPKDISRNELDGYITFCQQNGAKGMAWARVTDGGMESTISKFFSPALQKEIIQKTGAKKTNTLLFIADTFKVTHAVLDKLRQKLARDLGLLKGKENEFKFCWVMDFPLFEWNEESDKWEPAHHPFCMPYESDLQYLETDPGKVHCTQYDLVLNGIELASGSIRIHKPELQERVMKVIGLTKKDLENKFGFLLESFNYGAPPHGGMGIGFDRVVASMLNLIDIREVIAFPKNKAAQCPMDGSPSDVDTKQLKELHIKLDVVKK